MGKPRPPVTKVCLKQQARHDAQWNEMALITPFNVAAALLTLIPYLAVAFFPDFAAVRVRALPVWMRLACPAALSIPYLLVACGAGMFRWGWFALYALVPVAIAVLAWPGGTRGCG